MTHRASAPYKAFRAAVGEENLLERPSDLRHWRPTGIGFLTRAGPVNLMDRDEAKERGYVVVDEMTPSPGMKSVALEKLGNLAEAAESAAVGSFWVLESGLEDNGELYVFSRFDSKAACESFEEKGVRLSWHSLESVCQWSRRTTWVDSGLGFISR